MKHAIYSDIHGDLANFNIFINYVACKNDVDGIIIAGDLFGMKGLETAAAEMATSEMNNQYGEIEKILSELERSTGKRIMLIAGNYDSDFRQRQLGIWDLHKKSIVLDGLKFAGYSGHYHKPHKVLQETTMDFDAADATNFFEQIRPDVVITHSRIKEYLRKHSPLLSITGHTHTYDFYYDESETAARTVALKPGAIGHTTHDKTGESLPQTFVFLDYADITRAELYTIQNCSITSTEIRAREKTK